MALTETAMEPPSSLNDRLCYADPLPESRWFTSSERARCRTFIGCFIDVFGEVNARAVSRTKSWEINDAFCWCVVYEKKPYPGMGYLDHWELVMYVVM